MSADLHLRILETNLACENQIVAISNIERDMLKVESKFENMLHEKIERIRVYLDKLYQETIDPSLSTRQMDFSSALNKIGQFQELFDSKRTKLSNLLKSCTFLKFISEADTSIMSQIEFSLKYRRMMWQLDESLSQ